MCGNTERFRAPRQTTPPELRFPSQPETPNERVTVCDRGVLLLRPPSVIHFSHQTGQATRSFVAKDSQSRIVKLERPSHSFTRYASLCVFVTAYTQV